MSFETKNSPQPALSQADRTRAIEDAKKKALGLLKQKVVIVNAEHLAEMEARDAADAHMTESKGNAGFFKKLWKHTFFDEYYRQKELTKVRSDIKQTGNIYTGAKKEKKLHDSAMQAVAKRFTSEYDEAINNKAGEERKMLSKEDGRTALVSSKIKKLVLDYAKGGFDEAVFKSEKNKIISSVNHELLKGANTYADNLLEIAKNAKLAIEHGAKIEELDLDFDVIIGRAKSSIKTEAKNNWIDKSVEAVKKTQIGRFVNPATLSAALGIAYSAGIVTGKLLLKNRVSQIATLGGTALVSGALAAANESQRLASERRQHSREMAKGGKITEESPRRESMEKYAYQTESAANLIKNLRDSLFTKDAEGKEVARELPKEKLNAVFSQIAGIEARNAIADRKKIDLISYSSIGEVEKERTELTILLARSKVELRKQLGAHLKGSLPSKESFDTYLAKHASVVEKAFYGGEKGIDARDRAFSMLKLRRSALVMGKTVLSGLVVGGITQELMAGADQLWGGQREGLVEGLWHQFQGEGTANKIQTPLEHVRGWITGSPSHLSLAGGHQELIGGAQLNLPEGVKLVSNPDATFNLIKGDQIISDHVPLSFDDTGALDAGSIQRLGAEGIIATPVHSAIENAGTEVYSAKEYVTEHSEHTQRITRDLWYDNDTPKPIFDQNELRVHWGGEHGTGVDAKGNFIFDASRMTSDGSFHEDMSVDAKEKIKNGGLKMLLSLSRDTQNQVFEVPIDASGKAIIDPKSEIGKLFFSVDDKGKAVFHGRFAEVAETFGKHNGSEHVKILATYEGHDNNNITVPGPKEIVSNNLQIPLDDEPPYFIPLVPRTPFEPVLYKAPVVKNIPAGPSITKIEHIGYAPYNERLKKDHTDLNLYRNDNKQIEQLIADISSNKKLNKKYSFITERLDVLRNYKNATPEIKQLLLKETYLYNRRYAIDKPITVDEFVSKEIRRIYTQVENIYIENSKAGDKPFNKDFYEQSKLIKGLENSEEIVIILDDPIGDAVLTLPLIISINKYLQLNGKDKPIKVISRSTPDLYKYMEEQFSNVQILSSAQAEDHFKNSKKERFVFNTNKSFENYNVFSLNEKDSTNPAKVMSVDWASWQKEESPIDAHTLTKYDPLPARITRTFEIMVGQKLFEDIKNTEKYIERVKNFETESEEIRKKYNIKAEEKVITISAGSSATPKEYSPDKWAQVIDGIFENYPNAHILFLDDPEPNRRARYGAMIDARISKKGYKISRVNESLSKMNTILSMSDTVVTPDTGIGHYAGALGTKTVMLYLSDPVLWSTPGVRRVIHEKGYDTYKKGLGSYSRAWDVTSRDGYYVEDSGIMVGASDMPPAEVLEKIKESPREVIKKRKEQPEINSPENETRIQRENARLAKEFIEKVKKSPTLKKNFKKGLEKYEAIVNYKDLKDGSEQKINILEDFKNFSAMPENGPKTLDTFLKEAILVMNAEFVKQLKSINKAEENNAAK